MGPLSLHKMQDSPLRKQSFKSQNDFYFILAFAAYYRCEEYWWIAAILSTTASLPFLISGRLRNDALH